MKAMIAKLEKDNAGTGKSGESGSGSKPNGELSVPTTSICTCT